MAADCKLATGMKSSVEAEHNHFQDSRQGDGKVDKRGETVFDVCMVTLLLNTA